MRHFIYIILLSTFLISCAGGSGSSETSTNNSDSSNEGNNNNNGESTDTDTDNKQPALIDIVTYNIEWLGNPDSAKFDGSVQQQNKAAAEDILKGEGEIYALQEIGGQTALMRLISQLNTLDGVNDWSGNISDENSNQALAFIYKTNVVANVRFETLLKDKSFESFSGRSPYMMTADIVINNSDHTLRLVNLHLKCCSGTSNTNKRANAMSILLPYLHQQYSQDNIVVLGDFNIAQRGGSAGEILDWGFYNDRDNDQLPDYSHAAGSVADTKYNPANKDSDIDHILISNELKKSWLALPEQKRNQFLETTVSDHSPVSTTLDLSRIR